MSDKKRLLLLINAKTYRAPDFLAAARKLGVALTVAGDHAPALPDAGEGSLTLDFSDPEGAAAEIVRANDRHRWDAVVALDDAGTRLAARAQALLGLAGNPEESVAAAGDKLVFREITRAQGLPTPEFREVPLSHDPVRVAEEIAYPCVLKPRFLSASRGVVRADDPAAFVTAFHRVAALLSRPEYREHGGIRAGSLLVEAFVPGPEVAVEGLVEAGEFRLLAFFDKPDPLDGPFFQESLLVTPSRHPESWRKAALDLVQGCVAALGIRSGAVHAELRMNAGRPVPLEIAPRSIGGHCSRVLRFGAGMSLEELILRQALGLPGTTQDRERSAAGVMMIPIPKAGIFRGVEGVAAAREVPGIVDVEIAATVSQSIEPPPEGERYLGFIFARAFDPEAVESALRGAHAQLQIVID